MDVSKNRGTTPLEPIFHKYALAGHGGLRLERNLEARHEEVPCESAGLRQVATEQVPARENTADPSSRPNEGTRGTDTGASCSQSKIPAGL